MTALRTQILNEITDCLAWRHSAAVITRRIMDIIAPLLAGERRKFSREIGPAIFLNRASLCSSCSGKGSGLVCSDCCDQSAQEAADYKVQRDRLRLVVKYAADQLCTLFVDEDLTDEKLQRWAEGEGPSLHDRLLRAEESNDDRG